MEVPEDGNDGVYDAAFDDRDRRMSLERQGTIPYAMGCDLLRCRARTKEVRNEEIVTQFNSAGFALASDHDAAPNLVRSPFHDMVRRVYGR